jgi:hypothetical protein
MLPGLEPFKRSAVPRAKHARQVPFAIGRTALNTGDPEYQGSNESLIIRSAHAQQKLDGVTR